MFGLRTFCRPYLFHHFESNDIRVLFSALQEFPHMDPEAAGRKFCWKKTVLAQSTRSFPQKNTATVPGPVWLPMVVPILLIRTLPSSLGKRSSIRSATALASS